MNSLYPRSIPDENSSEAEEVLSVAEYIQTLNAALQPHVAAVQGEISQVMDRGGAAVYFCLRDKTGSAVIECLIWRNRLHSTGIELQEGMEVKIVGNAEIYAPTGRLKLMVQYMTPLGEGKLKLAFEKLKKELEEAGFFDQDRKRRLPQYVRNIGLITSESAAAKRDFEHHLGQRGYKIFFYDVRVEGIKAVDSIVEAVRWFNENARDIEVLVLTRGGGSLESLQAFNTVEVAKALYGSKIPVMTAIGHEQDLTIADLVADIRASVPTHAGKLLCEPWERAADKIDSIDGSITSLFRNKLRELDATLTHHQDNFISCFGRHLSQSKRDLDMYQSSMMRCFKDMLNTIKGIEANFSYNYERFEKRIREVRQIIATYDKQMMPQAAVWLNHLKAGVTQQEKLLQSSDPQLKLKQGFSIVKNKSGKILRSSKKVQVGDILSVQFFEGSADTKVKSTN